LKGYIMSKHWAKEELHHSFIAGQTDRFLNWLLTHRDYALGGAVAVVALGVLSFYFVVRHGRITEVGWEKYFQAQQYAAAGKMDESLKLLDDISGKYSGSSAGTYAALFKADLLFDSGKFKEAAPVYQSAAAGARQKLLPFALSGLAAALQASGDYSGSIDAANRFLDKYSAHFLAQQVYLTLALSQELSGKAAEAASSYKKLRDLFPNTYGAEIAAFKLAPKK